MLLQVLSGLVFLKNKQSIRLLSELLEHLAAIHIRTDLYASRDDVAYTRRSFHHIKHAGSHLP